MCADSRIYNLPFQIIEIHRLIILLILYFHILLTNSILYVFQKFAIHSQQITNDSHGSYQKTKNYTNAGKN
ncbi:hypothetical protein ES705_48741 [subsurface metagenome]